LVRKKMPVGGERCRGDSEGSSAVARRAVQTRFATPGKALPVREDIAGENFHCVVIFDGYQPKTM
jgi:hypothetical protein